MYERDNLNLIIMVFMKEREIKKSSTDVLCLRINSIDGILMGDTTLKTNIVSNVLLLKEVKQIAKELKSRGVF